MKTLRLLPIALLTISCSNSPTEPTPVPLVKPAATADTPLPVDPPLTSPVPVWTISGNNNARLTCQEAPTPPAGDYVWNLAVSDSGPKALRTLTMVHHSDTAGCASTIQNPRDYVLVNGQSNYEPHTSGTLQLTLDSSRFKCGRVQVDSSLLDTDGRDFLIIGQVINYGVNCPEPPPPVPVPPPAPPPATPAPPVPPITPPTPPSTPPTPPSPPGPPPEPPSVPDPPAPPSPPSGPRCEGPPTGSITSVTMFHTSATVTAGQTALEATYSSSRDGVVFDSATKTVQPCESATFNIGKQPAPCELTLKAGGTTLASLTGAACTP